MNERLGQEIAMLEAHRNLVQRRAKEFEEADRKLRLQEISHRESVMMDQRVGVASLVSMLYFFQSDSHYHSPLPPSFTKHFLLLLYHCNRLGTTREKEREVQSSRKFIYMCSDLSKFFFCSTLAIYTYLDSFDGWCFCICCFGDWDVGSN